MNDQELEEFRKKLREAVPSPHQAELPHDLWPKMLARMAEPRLRVAWYDWLLLGASGLAACLFPSMIPALLYHL